MSVFQMTLKNSISEALNTTYFMVLLTIKGNCMRKFMTN